MEQRIESPSEEDLARIEEQRDWVRGHFEPDSRHLYLEYHQKLRLLDAILANGWIEPDETWKLQSLGITLGDALIQREGYDWVTVEDQYGRDPALKIEGTTMILFPLTMISKRIESGETVDVYQLIDGIVGMVDESRAKFPEGS